MSERRDYWELGLEGCYLEDSYVLALHFSGSQLRLRMTLVLTEQHPEYRSPLPDEQYCYRDGALLFEGLAERPGGAFDHDSADPAGLCGCETLTQEKTMTR